MKHAYPVFDPKEFEVAAFHPSSKAVSMDPGQDPALIPPEPLFNHPITPRENLKRKLSGENPCWLPYTGWCFCDVNNFRPRFIPDNYATHLIFDGEEPIAYDSLTQRGWFNLDWVYVPAVGGATVKPGNPLITDMNDWEKLIEWPDLDALDWKEMGEKNKEYLNTPQFNELGILDGFWERLMSLMDVSGAAMALIDEDQQDAVKAFFDKYADFLIDYIRRTKAVCNLDGVLIHDDWGTQNGPFFSLETAREMLVPYIKRVVDYIHSEGMYYEQHSCGNCTKLVSAFIETGIDFWNPQPMNDTAAILELCRGTHLHISIDSDPIPENASADEIRQIARNFVDTYKNENVLFTSLTPNEIFLQELYQYSRQAYAEA
ncbi:MAG: uroporphyrinogen decarboxylase family protein [Ruminococcus sp.]|jgi:hypothetical protein